MVWYGMVWYGMIWYGMVWYGMVWYGMVWYGMVWYGMVWYGMVWYGMVWYGMVLLQICRACKLLQKLNLQIGKCATNLCQIFSLQTDLCLVQNIYKFVTKFATEKVVSKSICKLKANYNNTKIIYAYGRKLLINI